jgi:hypothetical protein
MWIAYTIATILWISGTAYFGFVYKTVDAEDPLVDMGKCLFWPIYLLGLTLHALLNPYSATIDKQKETIISLYKVIKRKDEAYNLIKEDLIKQKEMHTRCVLRKADMKARIAADDDMIRKQKAANIKQKEVHARFKADMKERIEYLNASLNERDDMIRTQEAENIMQKSHAEAQAKLIEELNSDLDIAKQQIRDNGRDS